MSVTTDLPRSERAELLAWDTEFWGLPVSKGEHSKAIDDWAFQNTRGCLCLLIPASDVEDAHRAERNGARLVDVRVKFDRITAIGGPSHARPFRPDEVDALASIARTAFRGVTRFYADPHFEDERCDDLYETWLRSSCEGWAQQVLTTSDRDGPLGFITLHVDGPDASIGLIAVAERARGKGLGVSLTRAAIDRAASAGATKISVVTQGRNVAAQRTFQHAGFQTCEVGLWFHSWYGKAGWEADARLKLGQRVSEEERRADKLEHALRRCQDDPERAAEIAKGALA